MLLARRRRARRGVPGFNARSKASRRLVPNCDGACHRRADPAQEDCRVGQPKSHSEHLPPGTTLQNRYRIEQHVGSGGYASVYRAIDLKAREERAIKEVTDTDPGVRRQFELEAGLLTHSDHPNIPLGYQIFEERGRLYLVMEFIHGRDLEELLNESLQQRRRPLEEEPVLEWAISVCDALVVMHEREVPIIHRDIKPANIKITPENRPILIDFGLAKLQTGGATRTAAQGVSPGFAPPEQYMARGKTDARTDIYGLGATLYACLTGKDPPDAPTRLLAQTGHGAKEQALVPPRHFDPQLVVSELTDRIVVKTLELSPSARYASAQQLRDDLVVALRRVRGESTGHMVAAPPPLTMVTCQHCGEKTRADAPRCRRCGAALAAPRAASLPAGTGKRAAQRGQDGARPAAAALRASLPPAAAARATQAPSPRQISAAPAARPAPVAPAAVISGKQPVPSATAHPAARAQASVEAARARPVAIDGRTSSQVAMPASGAGHRAAAPAEPTAVMGALALAGSAPAPAVTMNHRTAAPAPARARQQAQPARVAPAQPAAPWQAGTLAVTPPRSWLNFGGPELSSLGKGALALAAIETCWGALVLALAILEIAAQNAASKPYVILAGTWFALVLVLCLVGGQMLSRPVYRRGRISRGRRAVNGAGLVLYSLAVHAVAIWGILVFADGRPNAPLAITAFVLFAVNVFMAGVLSLANMLG
jgi:serine/threonine-protein kinase